MLERQFGFIQKMSDIDFVRLYMDGSFPYMQNDISLFSFDQTKETPWYRRLQEKNSGRHWLPPGFILDSQENPSDFFSYLGILYDPANLQRPVGMLRVELAREKVDRALENLRLSEHVAVFLAEDNRLLYGLPEKGNRALSDAFLKEYAPQNSDWYTLNLQGESYFARTLVSDITGWSLVVLLPTDEIFAAQNSLYRELFIVMLLIVLISALLSYATFYSALKRIFILSREMNKIESGRLQPGIIPRGKDEIGMLMRSFKYMTRRMSRMIQESYSMGEAVKNAELNALQAQINPHFLYNSLDLINCLAIQRDIPEIVDMVNALVEFYKLSLNNGRESITLAEELSHVEMYVRIQNLRFERQIRLISNREPWMNHYLIPKIILQPLVENSIMHGILEREDELEGIIRIHFEEEESGILITIEDNGVGMDKDKINAILQSDAPLPSRGYGIKNIHERLKLFFGPEYGLSFCSVPGQGTSVYIPLPKRPTGQDAQ